MSSPNLGARIATLPVTTVTGKRRLPSAKDGRRNAPKGAWLLPTLVSPIGGDALTPAREPRRLTPFHGSCRTPNSPCILAAVDPFLVACGILGLAVLWGLWPWWWVVDRKRTGAEKVRIVLGLLLVVATVFAVLWYTAMIDFVDGPEDE